MTAELDRIHGSIVVPAHNEAAVVARTLGPLAGLPSAGVQLVVVANGCTDDTASVARSSAPSARVIETPIPSKVHALRLGEAATELPRLYLDADIQLTERAARDTLAALLAGAVAARPPIRYNAEGASWAVRRYFAARQAMPSVNAHAWGAGIYGLSAAARDRFQEFPEVVGDDLFVDRLLGPGELVVVDTDPVVVSTPRTSRSLTRVLRRVQRTKADLPPAELAAVSSAAPGRYDTEKRVLKDLVRMPRSRGALVNAVVYVGFAVASRVPVRGPTPRWERDDSSRSS